MKKMKRCLAIFLFAIILCGALSSNASAYVKNGYVLSSPTYVGIYSYNTTYASKIYTYAKKCNQCPELYLYESNSAVATITAELSSADNGTYGVTYHYGNDTHSIVFYSLWQTATDVKKNETIVHEFGHAVGLAHTQAGNESISVMREYGFNEKAYPLSDDKAGITAIYG